MRAITLWFACLGAWAQAPGVPVCWPLLANQATGYQGGWLMYGEGAQCRWIAWPCRPMLDTAKPVLYPAVAGLKASNPDTTVLGRVRTLQRTADKDKPTIYALFWRTYVMAPIDPICKAEMK